MKLTKKRIAELRRSTTRGGTHSTLPNVELLALLDAYTRVPDEQHIAYTNTERGKGTVHPLWAKPYEGHARFPVSVEVFYLTKGAKR